jgi:deoxyadenosine/deoxycytidine kinase
MNQNIKKVEADELSEVEKQLRFNRAKKMIITFGAPGAGKTTLLKEIKKSYNSARIVSETNKIFDQNTVLGDYLVKATEAPKDNVSREKLEDVQGYYFVFQMAILPERFLNCFYAQDHSLIDDSILGTYAYSMALHELKWLNEKEYEVFQDNFYRYLDFHPKPTKIIFLSCDVDVLMDRIVQRSKLEPKRGVEINYSRKYLETLNTCFQETADRFSSHGYEFIPIDTTDQTIEEVRDTVKQELAETLNLSMEVIG